MAELTSKYEQAMRELQELNAFKTKSLAENSEQTELIEQLESQLNQVNKQKNSLNKQLDDANSSLEEETRSRHKLQSDVKNLQTDLDQLKEQHDEEQVVYLIQQGY